MEKLTKTLLIEEFKNGYWHEEIAKKYGLSKWSIYNKVKGWNINIPRKNHSTKDKTIKFCKRCGKKYIVSKYEGYCSYNCWNFNNLVQKSVNEFSNTRTDLGKEIQELRIKHYSYSEIAKILHCSKSTVSYNCSKSTRDKIHAKKAKMEPWKAKLIRSVSAFYCRKVGKGVPKKYKDWNHKFRSAVSGFRNRKVNNMVNNSKHYSYKDVLKHFGGTSVKCYLTGRNIDILKDDYNLDHIIPVSKGGSNEIANMGITCPEANMSKSGLTVDEYLSLYKEVLENFGYQVIKL